LIGTNSRYKLSLPPLSPGFLQRFSNLATTFDTQDASPHKRDYSILVLIGETVGLLNGEILSCLRNDCGNGLTWGVRCSRLSREHLLGLLERQGEWQHVNLKSHDKSVKLHIDAGTAIMTFNIFPDGNTECELLLACLWFRNRLWHLALTHGHINSSDSETKLSFQYAIRIAGNSLVVLKLFRIGSLENGRDDMVSYLDNPSCLCLYHRCWFMIFQVQQCFDIAFDFLYAAAEIRTQITTNILDMEVALPSVSTPSPLDDISLDTMIPRNDCAKTSTMSVLEVANGLLGFFALFDNGKHPRFKDYMFAYQEFMREA
jgi:hypothetical protein